MRGHLISILHVARNAMGRDADVTLNALAEIETEAMAALHGDKTIVPSKLFGEISIPQNIITYMSNGENDMWFSVSAHIDVNVFYSDGWQFNIYPVKHGEINTDTELETGKL